MSATIEIMRVCDLHAGLVAEELQTVLGVLLHRTDIPQLRYSRWSLPEERPIARDTRIDDGDLYSFSMPVDWDESVVVYANHFGGDCWDSIMTGSMVLSIGGGLVPPGYCLVAALAIGLGRLLSADIVDVQGVLSNTQRCSADALLSHLAIPYEVKGDLRESALAFWSNLQLVRVRPLS